MPLSITKIAFGAKSVAEVESWFAPQDNDGGKMVLSTRYLPKRHEEMHGGSLYWIFNHVIIGRSPLCGFEQREDGRWSIILERKLIATQPRPKRAHQGWRYLEGADAPLDLSEADNSDTVLPPRLVHELTRLALM